MSQILRQKWDILPKMERVRQKWDTFETAILNEKYSLKNGSNNIMLGRKQESQEVLLWKFIVNLKEARSAMARTYYVALYPMAGNCSRQICI